MFLQSNVLLALASLVLVINALGLAFTIHRRRSKSHELDRQRDHAEDRHGHKEREKELAAWH